MDGTSQESMQIIILIVGVFGSVISFIAMLLIAVVAFVIKGISNSVKTSHERLDDQIKENTSDHTAIRNELQAACSDIRKLALKGG